MNFDRHCSEESLELYALGQLDNDRVETLEEHILICEPCCARLDAADAYVRAMRGAALKIRQQSSRKSSAPAFTWNWFGVPAPAWGAAAVAACAVIVFSTAQVRREFPGGQPVTATLVANRGETFPVPAYRKLDLTLDAKGLQLGPRADVELVDAVGTVMQRTTLPDVNDSIRGLAQDSLRPGGYFVRIYKSGTSAPIREYALVAK